MVIIEVKHVWFLKMFKSQPRKRAINEISIFGGFTTDIYLNTHTSDSCEFRSFFSRSNSTDVGLYLLTIKFWVSYILVSFLFVVPSLCF